MEVTVTYIAVELINAGAMQQMTDTVMFFFTTCL